MGIWIGVDGGGSKTEFVAINELGVRLASYTTGGLDYHQYGLKVCCDRLAKGVERLSLVAAEENILGMGIGMPTYGEGGAEDEYVANQFRAMFLNIPTTIVNDAKVGWAGALAMNPGVNIVAGTGSIAFGCDGNGNCARSGGWSELFSDEGSGYWLGRMALGLFAKESDGRAPKSALYYLMKTHLDIRHDEEICSIARQKVFTSRHNVAKLQLILANAALQGDESAAWLYNLAGRELASCVHAVVKKLNFKGVANVSYSGGIFNVGDLILAPFKNALGRGVVLHEPILCPEVGAALIAVEQFQPNSLQNLKDILVRNCK